MKRTNSRRVAARESRRRVLLAAIVALTTILTLFGSPQLATAQTAEPTPEQGEVIDPGASDARDPALTPGTGSVRIHVFECPVEYRGVTGGDYFDACSPTGMADVNVRLTTLSIEEVVSQQGGAGQGGAMPTEFDESQTTQLADGPGVVEFTELPANDYTVVLDLPGATNNFYAYCSDSDTDSESTVSPNDENNGSFSLEDGQNILCDWYVIPDPNGTLQAENESGVTATSTSEAPVEGSEEETATSEATVEPTSEESVGGEVDPRGETPTSEASVEEGQVGGAADGASITIDMRTCPTSFVDPRAANYDTFAASCLDGAADVTLRLTDVSNNNFTEQVTNPEQNNTFSGLPDGTYTLYSNIPGDTASEFVYCVADGGDRYQKEFNDNGVTTFGDMTGEQIACSWFVVAEESRGEETGGSLTLHASVCPVAYQGNNHFQDCHDEGIGESPFRLDGPGGTSVSGTTAVADTGGPGLVAFTGLAAGSYSLQGGPPGEFGSVVVYCSDQQSDAQIAANVNGTQASFDVAEGQDVLCDWYFVPEDARGEPTEEPETRAEILVTLFDCAPRADGYAGWAFSDLDDTCTETLNDVPFRLGDVGAPPLTASTGDSGDGAVRFYDLLAGNYTVKPTLPEGVSNVALYCSINGSSSVYQKSLENGETTFVDVDGEDIACSWFVTNEPEAPAGPNGSITVREFVCEGDKSTISDWEQDCVATATGSGYTLNSSSGDVNEQGTPNASGVVVFNGLADDFYSLKQDTGTWCRATAEHVDSSSRVIVKNGGNTDVYLFHCGDVLSLPSTGTGTQPPSSDSGGFSDSLMFMLIAAALLIPALGMTLWATVRRTRHAEALGSADQIHPVVTEDGTLKMRFR